MVIFLKYICSTNYEIIEKNAVFNSKQLNVYKGPVTMHMWKSRLM